MTEREDTIRRLVDDVTKKFTAEGRLVEAGFGAFMILCYPRAGLTGDRVASLRDAFFSGAEHLFRSITASLLDDDAEPTDDDLRRMSLVDSELEAFVDEFAKRKGLPNPRKQPGGRA